MKKILILAICLLSLGVNAQNQQTIGANNTQLYLKGFVEGDSIWKLRLIDTAIARTSYPSITDKAGVIGAANGHPFIWTGTHWLALDDSIAMAALADTSLTLRAEIAKGIQDVNNGLTKIGTEAKLGGVLGENTTISANSYNFSINGFDTVFMNGGDIYTSRIRYDADYPPVYDNDLPAYRYVIGKADSSTAYLTPRQIDIAAKDISNDTAIALRSWVQSNAPTFSNCLAADSTTDPTNNVNCYTATQAAASYDSFLVSAGVAASVSAVDIASGEVKLIKGSPYWSKVIVPVSLTNYINKDTLLNNITLPSTNLFDGTINYGTYISTTTGNFLSAAGWARTNKLTVLPSTTYSIAGTGNLHDYAVFYNASGTFVGYQLMTTTLGGYSFTTTSGAYKVAFNVTNSGQTGIENTLQLNKSGIPLPYESPTHTTTYVTIKPRFYSDSLYTKSEINNKLSKSMFVIVDTPTIYIRTYWSSTQDLIQVLRMDTSIVMSIGEPLNFYGTYLINNAAANDVYSITSAMYSGKLIHYNNDDAAPVEYNNTYIGGNHGALYACQLTATAHGKTTANSAGSYFTDATGTVYYIIKVIDANTLWVLSANAGTGDLWNFDITPVSPLAYVGGGTSTSNITFSGFSVAQLLPSKQAMQVKFLADGKQVWDGVYSCNEFEAINTYRITDLPAIIDTLQVNHTKSLNDTSIASSSAMSVRFRFDAYGGNTVLHSFGTYKDIAMNYVGLIQFINLYINSGDTLYMEIPGTLPYSGNDFAAGVNINSWSSVFPITSSYWADTTTPPFIYSERIKNGANKVFFTAGYSPVSGITKLSARKNYVNTAGSLYSTKKMYPYALDSKVNVGGKVSAGQYWQGVAFRSYTNPENNPRASFVAYYKDLDCWIVCIGYQQSVVNDKIKVPDALSGYKVSVLYNTSSINTTSEYVDNGYVYLNTTGSKQYIVLKLIK